MEKENETPVSGDEVVVADEVTENKEEASANAEEANESADGQTEDSPPSEEDTKSRSQRQRERRREMAKELERKAADAQARLDRIKNAAEKSEEPKEDDFLDPVEYAAAKAVWRQGQSNVAMETDAASAEIEALQEQRNREIQANWHAAAQDAAARLENFEAVAYRDDLSVTPSMADIIRQADNGPDLLYHLGTRPAEAFRISQMSSSEQVFELGRLSAVLSAPKPKTETSAPEPIKPVGGKASAQKDPARMSNEEFRAWRKKGGGR